MSKKNEQKKPKTVKEITSTPVLFHTRLATMEYKVAGVAFKLKALNSYQMSLVFSLSTSEDGDINNAIMSIGLFRFGVVGWDGLKNENGELIDYVSEDLLLLGDTYPVIPESIIKQFDFRLIAIVSNQIRKITELEEVEKDKLDFI